MQVTEQIPPEEAATATRNAYAEAAENCAREPIHIPGSIQPHGFLFTIDSHSRVAQSSINAAPALNVSPDDLAGLEIGSIPGFETLGWGSTLDPAAADFGPQFVGTVVALGLRYEAIVHRHKGVAILECERCDRISQPPASTIGLMRDIMAKLAPTQSIHEMMQATVHDIRNLTGFDRVLIYRFDDDGGTVVAEDRNEELPSYLDLRFPASDIPPQARQIYRANRLRSIPDAFYTPVPIVPDHIFETGQPLDLSFSTLRSVSPVHLQYMKNMGTAASLSISMIRDGELWGLITCHNKSPRHVPFETRSLCDLMTQMLSSQLASADHREDSASRIALKSTQARLITFMAGEKDFLGTLGRHPEELMECARSSGAAFLFHEACGRFGTAPEEAQVRAFAAWLSQNGHRQFSTNTLGSVYEPGKEFQSVASGAIAIQISALHDAYLMWFRPEQIRTVKWGGDPNNPHVLNGSGGLSPRDSFASWKQLVQGTAEPWRASEISSAIDLCQSILHIVLRNAEEMAILSDELERSNQELEAFSYSVSHDLRAPFRHIVGFAELLRDREGTRLSETGQRYLSTILTSGRYAGTLVDHLLSFSQLSRTALEYVNIDTRKMVEELRESAFQSEPERVVDWRIGPLPYIAGDRLMLHLVFENLMSNALKYSRGRERSEISITAEVGDEESIFTIRDNGVGFDPQYSHKLFGVFQRLHGSEEFEGTGVGLANVRRIIARHGGNTWAEGAVGQGAAFSFSLPLRKGGTTPRA